MWQSVAFWVGEIWLCEGILFNVSCQTGMLRSCRSTGWQCEKPLIIEDQTCNLLLWIAAWDLMVDVFRNWQTRKFILLSALSKLFAFSSAYISIIFTMELLPPKFRKPVALSFLVGHGAREPITMNEWFVRLWQWCDVCISTCVCVCMCVCMHVCEWLERGRERENNWLKRF